MLILLALTVGLLAGMVYGEEPEVLEQVEVVGVTPTHGVGLPKEKIPANVQSATDADIERAQSLDLTDFLNRNLSSVTINAAQNNPLQPDLQYRGFTASPLLGVPQGIAVYQNAVRINEVFGDTVNWELIPESAIASLNLIGGANPLFGQNTLGGALSIRTKTGFTHPGHRAEAYGGAFRRVVSSIESGANIGNWGYFLTVNYFNEDGWRDDSPSEVLNVFATAGWRGKDGTLDFSVSHGDSELIGNGSSPVQLLELDRAAIFTSPDITENNLQMVNLEGARWLDDKVQLAGNLFYRSNDTDSFNGDASPFEECEEREGFLCEEDEADEPIEDQLGNLISEDFNAINNLSTREQRSYGGALQTTLLYDLLGRENQLIIGAGYTQGIADFDSVVEVAELLEDRSTSRSGRFVNDQDTKVRGRARTWSVYFTDTFSITPKLALTGSGRFNSTRVKVTDLSGEDPALNGEHDFDRFNPAGGFTYQIHPLIGLYGGYSESSRAPTPVELTCASEDAPCRLPNAFLADPPLKQVVAKSIEGGLRGSLRQLGRWDVGVLNWKVGAFHTLNEDDIIFQTTGGVAANIGFFDNIGDTQRLGVEVGLNGRYSRVDWFLNYSFIEATFRDAFNSSGPNHPLAEDFDGDGEADGVRVEEGDIIPGIPKHSLKFGLDVAVTSALTLGGDLVFNSDQFLRGDETNLLDTVDGYAIVNLRGEYRFNKYVTLFAKVENLFDADYETFGLIGGREELEAVLGPGFNDPRFLGPGAPVGGWVGVRVAF